jgi:predicted branched-subunit amino acid permease
MNVKRVTGVAIAAVPFLVAFALGIATIGLSVTVIAMFTCLIVAGSIFKGIDLMRDVDKDLK